MFKEKLPPFYFQIYLVLTIALHFVFPIKQFLFAPYTYFGTILIGTGIGLNLWADNLFKKLETAVKPFEKPTTLITEGPYKVSRHPMYLGMVFIFIGLAILLGSIVTFLMPFLFLITMEILFISDEERSLEETFGQEYEDYKKRVRKWL